MLVRDRPELEVLMLRRTPHAVFSPGASVFPGGAVEDDDRSPAASDLVVGGDDRSISGEMSLSRGGLGVVVAAARECFEEAGLLLARSAATGAAVDLTEASRRARLAALRHDLNAGRTTWTDVLTSERVVLDARDLHLFAHWRTPIGAPRRYDTWFFVAQAPHGDDGVHDDNELVASAWMSPSDALVQHRAGGIDLIFPTMRTLAILSRFSTAAEVIGALERLERDSRGRPAIVPEGGGERVALDGDANASFGWTVPLPDLDRRALAREGVA